MAHVDLDRSFVRVSKGAEPSEAQAYWSELFGSLHWSDLLAQPRVVLLAEASSGKSEELRETSAALVARGETAFFLRVEQLCEHELPQTLLPPQQAALSAWPTGDGPAWFFLDSVDEARLTQKRFEDALASIARGIGHHLARARVVVSCRNSDWRGQADRVALLQILPVPKEEPATSQPVDSDDVLLAPVREERASKSSTSEDPEAAPQEEDGLLVVQLVPLSREQQIALATAAGTNRADDFVDAVVQRGLDAWAERPGDLLDLAAYWNSHGSFGSLDEMASHNIRVKLSELDRYRPDAAELSAEQAWHGAERLAAAMTLARSFTLQAPGQEPDLSLAAGALAPSAILTDFNEPQINALVRRGAFAPSTYGRIKFHHRSTQEYLTAAFLNRLFEAGSETAVTDLLFADRYGVETVVPSLRPVAAWLALRQDTIRDEIIRREPMILLQYGDPRSLPLAVRQSMLLTLAERHANGEIANDQVDNRSLWAFGTPELADAIRRAWDINTRADFHFDLVRMIREGKIVACADLARSVAFDKAADTYHQIVGAQALEACGQQSDLRALADGLRSEPGVPSVRLSTELTKLLFPAYLSAGQLFGIIRNAREAEQFASDGFNYAIGELWESCPQSGRSQFLEELGALCLEPPLIGEWAPISKRHEPLAEAFVPVATRLVEGLAGAAPTQALTTMLYVISHANRYGGGGKEKGALRAAVNEHARVQRALFWKDGHAARSGHGFPVTAAWQISDQLWSLDAASISWLEEDIAKGLDGWDRRFAFSGLLLVHYRAGTLSSSEDHLRVLAGGDKDLLTDLANFLKPREDQEETERAKSFKRQRLEDQANTEKSWRAFRDALHDHPESITDMDIVLEKGGWSYELHNLTDWLRRKFGTSIEDAPLHWRALEPAFGRQVAEQYVVGMKLLWRTLVPEAPEHHGDGRTTVKWSSILAYGAVGLEAAEDESWTAAIGPEEASRAALHGLITERHYPPWMDRLINAHPNEAAPHVLKQLAHEWASKERATYVVNHLASMDTMVPDVLKAGIVEVVASEDPPNLSVLGYAVDFTLRIEFPPELKERILAIAKDRFAAFRSLDPTRAMRYLAILLGLRSERAIEDLAEWLEWCAANDPQLGYNIIGVMFGAHDPLVVVSQFSPSISIAERLVLLAYGAVRPSDDVRHEGTYTPNARDDAETGRNAVLKFLLETEGEDAYRAVLSIANHPGMALHRIRFLELARGMAERDAEFAAFSYDEFRRLRDEAVLPVRSADDLHRLVLNVLAAINWEFENADASSRAVLETAKTEDAVQEWLAEQFRLRARGRYLVAREGEVAEGNMPDIVVSMTHPAIEVAIEVKHGDLGWTVRTLRHALKEQLAEDYLRPPQRRRGVLVVSRHLKQCWIDTDNGRVRLDFRALITSLDVMAEGLTSNAVGAIKVRAVGIDASPRERRRASGQAGPSARSNAMSVPRKRTVV